MADATEAFREAMLWPDAPWVIEHVDITCDHCETEPIVGQRFKCTVCADVDLCGSCYHLATSLGAAPGAVHEAAAHEFRCMEGPERAIRLLLGKNTEPDVLDEFLRLFRPSESSCEHVAWICVSVCPGPDACSPPGRMCCAWHATVMGNVWESSADDGDATAEDTDSVAEEQEDVDVRLLSLEDRIDALLEAWEPVEASGERVTPTIIDSLAEQFNVVRGKWMCFPRTDQADETWFTLVTALAAGDLGNATEVKIAPRAPGNQEHAVCIYTDDYLNKEEVEDIRKRIRAHVPGLRLLYKPDIYTILGIYRGNKWKLNASILVDDP